MGAGVLMPKAPAARRASCCQEPLLEQAAAVTACGQQGALVSQCQMSQLEWSETVHSWIYGSAGIGTVEVWSYS